MMKPKEIVYQFANILLNNIPLNQCRHFSRALLTNCRVKNKWKNNVIIIDEGSRLRNCSFYFFGDNNVLHIGRNCILNGTTFWFSDNNNVIEIGNHTTVTNKTEFAVLEGTKITIGSDCMFSHDIYVRTSDSHSILDIENKRINNAKDILIGNHCWVGMQSLILKGACIGENSIVGARSVVTKQFEKSLLIAGHPAKVLKSQINWKRERV